MSAASRLDDLVRAVPPTRDRYVDFLRAASILLVVAGHWLMLLIAWDHGVIRSVNVIGRVPGLWLLTWLLQVMPVFFFVGGYANLVAYRSSRLRGEPVSRFVARRVRRLLIPSLAFLAVWAAVLVVLHVARIGAETGPWFGGFSLLRGVQPPGQTIPFGPLWFLAVYLLVVASTPVTVALHLRWRWWVPATMLLGAMVTDLVGLFGGHPAVRFGNVVFVLFLPHQLGHFYADGTMGRWPRWAAPAMAAAGLAGLVALTAPGWYPRSLLGTDLGEISNAYPPTLVYLAVGIWLIGLVLWLRPALQRWLRRTSPWRLTVAVNTRVMTLFLWHMTAYLLAILALWPLGFGHQAAPTPRWWAERPVWLLVPAAILALLVAAFGRYETRGRTPPPLSAAPVPAPRRRRWRG